MIFKSLFKCHSCPRLKQKLADAEILLKAKRDSQDMCCAKIELLKEEVVQLKQKIATLTNRKNNDETSSNTAGE